LGFIKNTTSSLSGSCGDSCSGLNDCSIQDLGNVDTAGLSDGDILCYHAASGTFINVAKSDIFDQFDIDINGGTYSGYSITLTDSNSPDIVIDLSGVPTELCTDAEFIDCIAVALAGRVAVRTDDSIQGDGTDVSPLVMTPITVTAGSTASASDNANGQSTIAGGDSIHFWSSDDTVNINVTSGSAIVDITSEQVDLTPINNRLTALENATDAVITGGTYNPATMSFDFTSSIGGGFSVAAGDLLDSTDLSIVPDTYTYTGADETVDIPVQDASGAQVGVVTIDLTASATNAEVDALNAALTAAINALPDEEHLQNIIVDAQGNATFVDNNGNTIGAAPDNNIVAGTYVLTDGIINIPLEDGSSVMFDGSNFITNTDLTAAINALPTEEHLQNIVIDGDGNATFINNLGNTVGTTTDNNLVAGTYVLTDGVINVPLEAGGNVSFDGSVFATDANLTTAVAGINATIAALDAEDFLASHALTGTTLNSTLDSGAIVSVDLAALDENIVDNGDGTFTGEDAAGNPITWTTDTDDQAFTSSDGSLLLTPTTQPNGQVDYDVRVARCLPNYMIDENNPLPFDKVTTISPLNGHCPCTGAVFALVAGSEVNIASVTINGDGTHDVRPSNAACELGNWEYQYTETCPDGQVSTATVSGLVDNERVEIARFHTNSMTGDETNLSLLLSEGGTYDIEWGDGIISNGVISSGAFGTITHNYVSDFNGFVIIRASACNTITDFRSDRGNWDFSLADLPRTLIVYQNFGANTTSGSIANLPPNLTNYSNSGQNITSGDIADLPSTLEIYRNFGQNTTVGNIADLPTGLLFFLNGGQNTTTGNIMNLPTGLTSYSNGGQNTTSGNIADLPITLTNYSNAGFNTTTGDIADLPVILTNYSNGGSNTTFGDLNDLPANLTGYRNLGNNTTTGDIANIPASVTSYINLGLNTTFGDISSLQAVLTFYENGGANTVTANSTAWNASNTFNTFIHGGVPWPTAQVDNALAALTSVTTWNGARTVDIEGVASAAGVASCAAILANGAAICVTT